MTKIKPLSRRSFLRGSLAGLGVSLALPPLEAMLNSKGAYADGLAEDRFFVLFFWGGGMPWHDGHGAAQAGHPDLWTPAQTGTGYSPSELLAPLAAHEVSVLTGLAPGTHVPSSPDGQGEGHMRGFMVSMTGDRGRSEGFDFATHTVTAQRPTLDQLVAKHPDFYATPARYRSVQVGVSAARFLDYGHWNAISYNGPDSLNPPIMEPAALYDHLFGVSPAVEERLDRSRALDAVLEDAHRLKGRLGAKDRERVDAHLEHLSEVQRRLGATEQSCGMPDPPSNGGDLIARTSAMAELLALAVSCGQTRVVSFMLTAPATTHLFTSFGASNDFHTELHNNEWDLCRAVTAHQMQAFAAFLDEFRAVSLPDGASLLDQGLIYGTSEYSEGYKHSVDEMPVVFAGSAGGALRTGMHVRDPDGTLSRAQLTALQALGLPFSSFGWHGAETDSPFTELFA